MSSEVAPDRRPASPTGRGLAVRGLVALLLVALLLGMAADFDTNRVAETRYLTTVGAVGAGDHAGEPVYLWTTASRVDGSVLTVLSPDGAPPVTVELSDASGAVGEIDPGDVVQVFGVAGADGRVDARRVVVHERGALGRTYVLSALGGVLAVGAFLRRWRPEFRSLTFVPRNGRDGATTADDETAEGPDG